MDLDTILEEPSGSGEQSREDYNDHASTLMHSIPVLDQCRSISGQQLFCEPSPVWFTNSILTF